MEVNRREFVLLAAAACAGCGSSGGGGEGGGGGGVGDSSGPSVTRVIDAGPASLYETAGVYDHFRHKGFFLVHENDKLTALSSDCTHRDCPLRALPDHTFSCKCHGSKFDEQGQVLHGPATRSLPQFPTSVDENGHLIVQVTRLQFDEE